MNLCLLFDLSISLSMLATPWLTCLVFVSTFHSTRLKIRKCKASQGVYTAGPEKFPKVIISSFWAKILQFRVYRYKSSQFSQKLLLFFYIKLFFPHYVMFFNADDSSKTGLNDLLLLVNKCSHASFNPLNSLSYSTDHCLQLLRWPSFSVIHFCEVNITCCFYIPSPITQGL